MGDIQKLACDVCDEDVVTLRKLSRGWFDVIVCSACFSGTDEAQECDFTDFPIAQQADSADGGQHD